MYGLWNSRTDFKFTTKSLEDYSALFVNVSGTTDSALVEVLGRDDTAGGCRAGQKRW